MVFQSSLPIIRGPLRLSGQQVKLVEILAQNNSVSDIRLEGRDMTPTGETMPPIYIGPDLAFPGQYSDIQLGVNIPAGTHMVEVSGFYKGFRAQVSQEGTDGPITAVVSLVDPTLKYQRNPPIHYVTINHYLVEDEIH